MKAGQESYLYGKAADCKYQEDGYKWWEIVRLEGNGESTCRNVFKRFDMSGSVAVFTTCLHVEKQNIYIILYCFHECLCFVACVCERKFRICKFYLSNTREVQSWQSCLNTNFISDQRTTKSYQLSISFWRLSFPHMNSALNSNTCVYIL